MPNLFETSLALPFYFGQVLIQNTPDGGFLLSHRDDELLDQLQVYRDAESVIEIAKYDDAGKYRPLKTAPNLRHGWKLKLASIEEVECALDHFYPGRLAIFAAWTTRQLETTPLRDTLGRQSGMYHIAAKISDQQINDLVANFCRSDGGCLRTILWRRDRNGVIASTGLPKEKFDPGYDQATPSTRPASAPPATVPLLCQESCNLLIRECRKIVKGESA